METPTNAALFADVSLPVPLDHAFTYSLPTALHGRAQVGARVLAPFGGRKLTGMIVRVHGEQPEAKTREVLRLLDEQPVLDAGMIALGKWISGYYCCPLGDVLRTMTPLTGEVRQKKVYSLTDAGRDSARQLTITDGDDPQVAVLRMLEARPMAASTIAAKIKDSGAVLKGLERKGWSKLADIVKLTMSVKFARRGNLIVSLPVPR